MTLPARINTEEHEKLSEVLKKEYVTDGDEMLILDVDPVDGWGLENVAGLKKTSADAKAKVRTLKNKLSTFEEDGELLDPVEARAAMAQVASSDDPDVETRIREASEKQVSEVKKTMQKTIDEKDVQLVVSSKLLDDQAVDIALDHALSGYTLIEDGAELLRAPVRSMLKPERDESGKIHVRVVDPKDPDGTPRVSMKRDQDHMDVVELLKEIKGTKPYSTCFVGTEKDGSGKTGDSKPSNATPKPATTPFGSPVQMLSQAHDAAK